MTESEHIRLLVCRDCKTIEPLPDYDGAVEHDHMLNYLVKPHRTNGLEHIGMLARVEASEWNNPRVQAEIAKQLVNEFGGETGLGSEFYNTRDTFKDDAMTCFKQHQRNPDCSDYRADFRKLTPGTNADRKREGMDKYHGPTRWLCDYCPVNSLVEQKMFDDALKKGKP